jgi:16S rRNA (cytosine1402-N4)-methyltransferase
MTGIAIHKPVMPKEVLEYLDIRPGLVYVDGTLGGAGHSSMILEKLGSTGHLYSFDQDQSAIDLHQDKANSIENWTLINKNFAEINNHFLSHGLKITGGLLLDLGLSSIQLDNPERGFSFNSDSELDMRLNPEGDIKAQDIVNKYKEKEIADIIFEFGEERRSREIAREIIAKRPFHNCKELGDLIKNIYARRSNGKTFKVHPATKTFQALRIAVNMELDVLKQVLNLDPDVFETGSRIVVISFHSLEDRIVKNFFRDFKQGNNGIKLEILTKKPLLASEEELEYNMRSRSAKLRAAVVYKK